MGAVFWYRIATPYGIRPKVQLIKHQLYSLQSSSLPNKKETRLIGDFLTFSPFWKGNRVLLTSCTEASPSFFFFPRPSLNS